MTFYRELANIYLLLVDVEMLSKNIKALKRWLLANSVVCQFRDVICGLEIVILNKLKKSIILIISIYQGSISIYQRSISIYQQSISIYQRSISNFLFGLLQKEIASFMGCKFQE
jgi:hypothetical protein